MSADASDLEERFDDWFYEGVDHADASLAFVAAFVERSKAIADLRAKDGRVPGARHRVRLTALLKTLSDVTDDLEKLLKDRP